jgi:hypothetical protein
MKDNNNLKLSLITILFLLIAGFIFAGITVRLKEEPKPTKFQIAAKYNENCNVIQYNHSGDARFHYFLDCSK